MKRKVDRELLQLRISDVLLWLVAAVAGLFVAVTWRLW